MSCNRQRHGLTSEFSCFGSKRRFILALASTEWHFKQKMQKYSCDYANLATFSGQPTRHEDFSSQQTGLDRLYQNFSAWLPEISASGPARLLI